MDRKLIEFLKAVIGILDTIIDNSKKKYEDWIKDGSNPQHPFFRQVISIIELFAFRSNFTDTNKTDKNENKNSTTNDDIWRAIKNNFNSIFNDVNLLKQSAEKAFREYYEEQSSTNTQEKEQKKGQDKEYQAQYNSSDEELNKDNEDSKSQNDDLNNEKDHIVEAEYK